MEIFFKNPVMEDNNSMFADAFGRNGFVLSYGTPETPVMAKGKFTIRAARSPRIRGRAINVAALKLDGGEIERFVEHIMNVREILGKELKIDLEREFRSCAMITNAWIRTGNDSASVLGRLKDINGIEELRGFTCHRTPFE
ncbi:MAG: hypothetical protein ACE5JV_03625, partial [Nitrososphaerales archaeon]